MALMGQTLRMTEYAIAAIGDDRPGIVASLSEALHHAGASIEDSSMTILGAQFAMLLVVSCDATREDLEASLAAAVTDLDLTLEVRAGASQLIDQSRYGTPHVVAAHGPDRQGLVTVLARVLADAQVNITNFGSRVSTGGAFAMWFTVDLPADVDADLLERALRTAGASVDLTVSVHPVEVEEL